MELGIGKSTKGRCVGCVRSGKPVHIEIIINIWGTLYHVRSITRPQVGAGEPTISANNLQSQKPARPGYYGQSIVHVIKAVLPSALRRSISRSEASEPLSASNVSATRRGDFFVAPFLRHKVVL